MSGLTGQRVLITRAADDAEAWVEPLRAAGAIPVILPCIECEPLLDPEVGERVASALPDADWLVFTSRRGVEAFSRLMSASKLDLPSELSIAVVGPATADAALAELGRVDMIAEAGTAESLAQALLYALEESIGRSARVLIAVAENAGSVLEDALRPATGECTRIDVYRTIPAPEQTPRKTLSSLGADKILLASPTAVAGFLNQVELDTTPQIFTIGPSTSAAVRDAALTVTAQATNPSLEGLMEAMQ